MYQYVAAIAKDKDPRSQWQTTDVHQLTFNEMRQRYSDVLFHLSNPALPGERWISLKDLLTVGVRLDMTPVNWLAQWGNKPLPDKEGAPTIEKGHVLYRDAWQAGYKFHHIQPGGPINDNLPLSDRTSLLLQKTNLDYADMHSKVLVTVNGLLHLTDYNSDGLHVIQGGKTVQHAARNHVGIINFADVGALSFTPITSGIIEKGLDTDLDLAECLYLNLNQDLTGKTVMLSIGGYLHTLDNVYQVVNPVEGIVKVRLRHVNLMHRIFESRDIISLSSMALTSHQMNSGLVSPTELFSDTVIESYMTLPQSFAIVVDAPNLYVEKRPLEKAKLPGLYYNSYEPTVPMQLRTGLMPEYWSREEWGKWVLSVTDNLSRNYHFETLDWREEGYVDPGLEPHDQYDYSIAHLMEIGTETVTW